MVTASIYQLVILLLQFELVMNSFLLSLLLVQSGVFLIVALSHLVVFLPPSLYQPTQNSTNKNKNRRSSNNCVVTFNVISLVNLSIWLLALFSDVVVIDNCSSSCRLCSLVISISSSNCYKSNQHNTII